MYTNLVSLYFEHCRQISILLFNVETVLRYIEHEVPQTLLWRLWINTLSQFGGY